jgi:carboxypeptidase T
MMRTLNGKIAVPIRILMIFIVCLALLLSFMPFVSFSSQPEETRAEPIYHTYEEMTTEILDIAQENSSLVMVENLTTTYEGRTLWAVKISDSPQINDSTEPDVLFMAGYRANSLISVEIAMYLLNHLTSNYGIDGFITELINTREIWIIPMVNPDGHEYVGNETENWEKNRRDNQDGTFGVNLNRNYDYEWGEDEHTSSDSVSQNYHGTGAFSEPETQAIKNLVQSQDFVFSLSFSSNGEMITYPWGYTNSSTSSDELFAEIAKDMAMYNGYSTAQSSQFEKNRGNADDWLYGDANVLPFTLYVGNEDIPQEGEIESIAQENLKACIYLIDIADDPDRAMTAEWTFMVYMGGDDSLLEQWGVADINEMEIHGSSPYVNIVVQFDRKPGGDDTNGNWVDTRRFHITKDYDTDRINSPLKGILGETNSGDPQTLLDFVNWSITNYPAEHYFLDIWGHGKGWQGVSGDSTDGGDWLEMNEIKSILPKFKERVDVVGFDNCNMAMIEVYTTFLGHADYIVGSEKEEDALGWPYDRIFNELNDDPWTSPLEISKFIAFNYVDWAKNNSAYSASISVVDMKYLSDM